ncbi:helix-turn-helix domain-containing protein [Aquisalimonas lutea]|uniref:helix-turn-helix domain-containing protein n=1 Tax=Aquisalimonas lutea TaxID=1327750 RepID=UPI00338E144D
MPTLHVFDAIARPNSFSRPAAEFRISHSAVSHRIKQLENCLGKPLFVRAGRRLRR